MVEMRLFSCRTIREEVVKLFSEHKDVRKCRLNANKTVDQPAVG